MPTPSKTRRLLVTLAMLTWASMWTASASAAVPWHPDLATARRASELSQRPVLAIFTASWSSATTTLDRTTLASDEAVALITACFEPVCVDVDANPEATRRLGITKVPTACIVTADEQLLTKFELPETPAGFVAAAARAAQEAALASATRSSSRGTVTETSTSLRDFTDIAGSGSGALPSFGGDGGKAMRMGTPAEIRGTVPPGGKAINAVAAKVRMLSDFASDDAVPASGSESAIAASFRESDISLPTSQPASPASMTPAAPPTTTVASMPASTTAATPASIPTSTPDAALVEPSSATASPIGTHSMVQAPSATVAGSAAIGSTTPQAPLSIEPGPSAPSNATARSVPWLGLPQQTQPSAAPRPEPATMVAAAPSTAGTAPESVASAPATASQPQTGGQLSTASPPAPGGAATARAETKPAKPTTTSSFLAAIQKPFSLFSKPATSKAVPGPTAPSSEGSVAVGAAQVAGSPAASAEPDSYGSMPVGLEGYCPVTLAERGVWVEGRAQWGARHRGRTYLFASAEQQKAFLADPDRYAPALSGDDPVLAFDAGKSTPGQRRYGVTYQSRTYLFSSTDTRDAFAANPQRYTSGAIVAENRTATTGSVVR